MRKLRLRGSIVPYNNLLSMEIWFYHRGWGGQQAPPRAQRLPTTQPLSTMGSLLGSGREHGPLGCLPWPHDRTAGGHLTACPLVLLLPPPLTGPLCLRLATHLVGTRLCARTRSLPSTSLTPSP